MSAVNDITGDAIKTKGATDDYRNNYDSIFRKEVVEDSNESDAAADSNEADK